MNKMTKVLIALVVIAGLATPAMAEMKLNGYYRLQMVTDNINSIGKKDARSDSQIDQRLRMKLTNKLSENVSFVYYAEVDTPWGQKGSTPSGSTEAGGKDGGDGVNLETKNVYLDLKMGAVKARAGLQGYSVGKNGVVLADDMAGLQIASKLSDNMDLNFFYSKLDEDSTNEWNDADLYSIGTNVKLSDAAKIGADVIYFDNNGLADRGTARTYDSSTVSHSGFFTNYTTSTQTDAEVYYLNLDGDFDFGMVKLEGQFAYSGGTINDSAGTDIDIAGYMASAKATADLSGVTAGLRATYYSSDDDDNDDEINVFLGDITGAQGEFTGENLHIFFTDATYNNTNGGTMALYDAAYAGYGLIAINATANFTFGEYQLNTGAGYFMAEEDTINGRTKKADSDLGYEVAAEIKRKLLEKVDVSLIGAYAGLGDFYNTIENNNDPDDIFLTKVVMTVKF